MCGKLVSSRVSADETVLWRYTRVQTNYEVCYTHLRLCGVSLLQTQAGAPLSNQLKLNEIRHPGIDLLRWLT